MARLKYYVIDTFTANRFRGNPAGVCLLDDWLPDGVMRSIAMENNLAETAFFVENDDGYHLRWFTPTQEVPLCGHATLASAFTIFTHLRPEAQEVAFRTLSGRLTVTRDQDWLEIDMPCLRPVPLEGPPPAMSDALDADAMQTLRVDADPNYLVILPDEATVRHLRPDLASLARFHPYGVAISAPGEHVDFVSRYFAPSYGIPEDPVTGSTHAALTPYWADRLGHSELRAAQLSPRGGHLRCRLEGDRVYVAGQAVEYLEGTIQVSMDGVS